MQRALLDRIIGRILDHSPDLSDIVLTAGKPIQAEVNGLLTDARPAPDPGPLLPFQTEAMALCLMAGNARLHRDLAARGSCDLAYELPNGARFRVNVFSQRGSLAMVLRRLPPSVPAAEELGLPKAFTEMAREQYGLVLVTGSTGSGKSTSLAALIDRINEQRPVHIVTLEDPVEFAHGHKAGTVSQRELGTDFDTFASGLRAALRQAPKVILVGEIRDRETMEAALQASETGHLVLGTLHTTDAGQTISRIAGLFDVSEERLVRARLAECLKCVLSQRLLPKVGGGRVAAFEVLRSTMRVKDLVAAGETGDKTFYNVLAEGGTYGMQTFDQHLERLLAAGRITPEAAMLAATDKPVVGRMIDRIKAGRGEKVSDIQGLELDAAYDAGAR